MHGLFVMTDIRQISYLKASSQMQCHIVKFGWFWLLYLSVLFMSITIVLRESNSHYPKSMVYNDAESKWKDCYLWPTFQMTNTDINLTQWRFTGWGDAPLFTLPLKVYFNHVYTNLVLIHSYMVLILHRVNTYLVSFVFFLILKPQYHLVYWLTCRHQIFARLNSDLSFCSFTLRLNAGIH